MLLITSVACTITSIETHPLQQCDEGDDDTVDTSDLFNTPAPEFPHAAQGMVVVVVAGFGVFLMLTMYRAQSLYASFIIIGPPLTLFSRSHPLWRCPNAMNMTHTCIFVKCNNCYKPPGRKPRKTKHQLRMDTCDHHTLQPFDNEDYYNNPYYASMEDEDNFPKVCVTCNLLIQSMSGTAV